MNLKFRTPVFKFKSKIPVSQILTRKKNNRKPGFFIFTLVIILTILPRARMGSESIADEAEGRSSY